MTKTESILAVYRKLADEETHPGFATDVVQAAEGIIAGRVVMAHPDAISLAERIACDELRRALNEAVRLMKDARGHYGIEESAPCGQPATEWDEIQDAMQKFTWRWEADSDAPPETRDSQQTGDPS